MCGDAVHLIGAEARLPLPEQTPRPEEVQEDPPEQIENLEHPAFIAQFGRSGQADEICGRDRFGRIDCLFNNAGGPAPTGSITSVSVEGSDDAMALLVRSVMLGMKHTAPVMMAQRTGSIINNASVAAHLAGYSSSMIYGAAKAAVLHHTRCAAMELGEHNVRVNSVSPGAIATGILLKALGLDARPPIVVQNQ